jgi:hypothetical protein
VAVNTSTKKNNNKWKRGEVEKSAPITIRGKTDSMTRVRRQEIKKSIPTPATICAHVRKAMLTLTVSAFCTTPCTKQKLKKRKQEKYKIFKNLYKKKKLLQKLKVT